MPDKRIRTTHAGSLPRPKELVALLAAESRGEAVDSAALARLSTEAVEVAVDRQLEVGVDIGNDGEQGRESFFSYVQHRLDGFTEKESRGQRQLMSDVASLPTFLEKYYEDFPVDTAVNLGTLPVADAPITYRNRSALEAACKSFQEILTVRDQHFSDTFWTVPSPGLVATAFQTSHYSDLSEFVHDLGVALRNEYEYVIDQGFLLQIDAIDLAAERHIYFRDRPLEHYLEFHEMAIEELNRALENVPKERVRLHVCWGNYEGPHHHDVELGEILPHLYEANVGGILLPFANPRHEHEYKLLSEMPPPPDLQIIAGVIDPTTNFIEHPEAVAQRIERVAEALGDPSRIVAGTDCGFDTAAGLGVCAEEVVWLKLRALKEGAAIASSRLF